eukprot:1220829-Heterocapsa_arctica.AAC.1
MGNTVVNRVALSQNGYGLCCIRERERERESAHDYTDPPRVLERREALITTGGPERERERERERTRLWGPSR